MLGVRGVGIRRGRVDSGLWGMEEVMGRTGKRKKNMRVLPCMLIDMVDWGAEDEVMVLLLL